jgi:hypothetical protein
MRATTGCGYNLFRFFLVRAHQTSPFDVFVNSVVPLQYAVYREIDHFAGWKSCEAGESPGTRRSDHTVLANLEVTELDFVHVGFFAQGIGAG